jgi:phage terminase large subunit-like protein
MEERGQYLNILTIVPSVDKETRARAISGQVKAKKVRFEMSADWWDDFKKELNAFPRGKHDDQVDAFAYIGLILDQVTVPEGDSDLYHDEWEAASRKEWNGGKNNSTGY